MDRPTPAAWMYAFLIARCPRTDPRDRPSIHNDWRTAAAYEGEHYSEARIAANAFRRIAAATGLTWNDVATAALAPFDPATIRDPDWPGKPVA